MFFKKKKKQKQLQNSNNQNQEFYNKLFPRDTNLKINIVFAKYNFEMMYDLAKIGIICTKLVSDNNKINYQCTLPFNFEIKNEDGKIYTHYQAATEGKEIIKKYRAIISSAIQDEIELEMFADIDNFWFSYTLRDDTYTKEKRDIFLTKIKEETDKIMMCYTKIEESIEKGKKYAENRTV